MTTELSIAQVARALLVRASGLLAALAACGVLALPTAAAGQGVGAGAIQGRVTDETGATLPGVTVTALSPALQVRSLSTVTDAAGDYRFVDLPAGLYGLNFELQGFQKVVREDLRLNVGFVARVDAVLKVGSLEESITVSGQSPVVDLTTTTGSTNFTRDSLDAVPTSKSIYEVLALTPGIRYTGNIDVGGSQLGNQQGFRNYGSSGQITPLLEGLSTRNGTDGSAFFFDFDALEEVQIKAVANDAEVGLPGTAWVAIVKSGGNDFHGRYAAAGQSDKLQSNNIDDDLRSRGITSGDQINYLYDVSADLGGRIVRDKLWFYGGVKRQRVVNEAIGYSVATGPDGRYGTADDIAGDKQLNLNNETIKVSYQPARALKAIGFYQRNAKIEPERFGDRFTPFESTNNYLFIPHGWKGELQGTPSNTILWNVLFGWEGHLGQYNPQEDVPGRPSRLDRETGLKTGPPTLQDQRHRSRYQTQGSVSLFPERKMLGGRHNFKLGYALLMERHGDEIRDRAAGNYLLVYDRVGGISGQPTEIQTFNLPIPYPENRLNDLAVYAKDTWTIGRLTANLGLRVERRHSYVAEQTKPQGTFGTAGQFAEVDVATWTQFAPRVGFAYDLTGNARTVGKATYGRFYHSVEDSFASNYNQNALVTTTYRWRDPDRNNDYTPGEVNLALDSNDFVTVTGASNNILNADLETPFTDEFSFGLEHEVRANLSAKALYVYKQQSQLFEAVNVLRPFSAFNVPLSRRDPGPDGVLNTPDDAGQVTIYDFDAAFRGAQFVGREFLNRTSRNDSYQTIEFTVNKRQSQNWDMLASFGATRNHRWIDAIPESPNDEYNALDQTWDYHFKLTGSYAFPYGIHMGAFYQLLAGAPAQRTYVFRSADPDGGRALVQQTTVTLRLEEFGERRAPNQGVLNLRATKKLRIGGSRLVDVGMDVFNALNANTAAAITYASGPTFGAISRILPPRIVRLSVAFSF